MIPYSVSMPQIFGMATGRGYGPRARADAVAEELGARARLAEAVGRGVAIFSGAGDASPPAL